MAALYAQTQTAVAANDWVEVLALGAQLQALDRNYRDVRLIMDKAQAQLTQPLPAVQPGVRPAEQGQAETTPQGPAVPAAAKAPASRRRQILLLGCAVLVLIGMCLMLLIAAGTYFSDQVAAVISSPTAAVLSGSDVTSLIENTATVLSPTPQPTAKATQTAEPTAAQPDPTLEPTDPSQAGELFSDTFDGKSSAANWELWQDESAEFRIGDGHLTAVGLDEDMVNWVNLVEPYDAFEASVDANILEGGRAAFFGFVFDGAGDNYVGCFVQGDNSAYCAVSVEGETEYSDWVVVDLSVLRDNAILFVAAGGQWAMAVNDQCVGSGLVAFTTGGQPALAVTTESNDERAVVAYDNFSLHSPTEQGLALLNCQPEYYDGG